MKSIKRAILPLLFLIAGLSAFSQNAYIEIDSDPGIKIYLDGKYVGITKAETPALIITGVKPGSHIIKAVLEGFQPQEKTVVLAPGQVLPHILSPFEARIRIRQEGITESQTLELRTGNLKIQSLPISIKISIPGLVSNSDKTNDEWYADDVPIGSYTATFEWQGRSMEERILIQENKLTHIFVNMVDRKIEYRSGVSSRSSVFIESIPPAYVSVNQHGGGNTPIRLDGIPEGHHEIYLTTFLDGEYYNDDYYIKSEIDVIVGKTSNYKFNFWEEYPLGHLNVVSDQPTSFSLNRVSKPSKSMEGLKTTFDTPMVSGDYSLDWNNGISDANLNLQIMPGKRTEVFLPIKRNDYRELYSLSDINGYMSESRFFDKCYDPLPEYKSVTRLGYNRKGNDNFIDNWIWVGTGTAAFFISLFSTIAWIDGSDGAGTVAAVSAGYCVLDIFVLYPLNFYKGIKPISQNVSSNRAMKAQCDREYYNLLSKWEKELDKRNSSIKKENDEIEQHNKKEVKVEIVDDK